MISALLGQNPSSVKHYRPDTKAGTAAIQRQAQLGSSAATGQAYGLAASGPTGLGSPMAIREAQRRAAMGTQQIQSAALSQQQQLEQAASMEHARQRHAASAANAQIAGGNSQALQKVAGLALGAGMMMSDERTKSVIGDKYGSQLAGHEDDRRVIWAHRDPRAMQEAAIMQRHAAEQGIGLSPQEQAQLQTAGGGGPSWNERVGMGLMQMSDERAKNLETENSSLRAQLAALVGGGQPKQLERLPVPGRSPEYANEAEFRKAEIADYNNSARALREQRAYEEQQAVKRLAEERKAEQLRALAGYERGLLQVEDLQRGPIDVTYAPGGPKPNYPEAAQTSDYRSKTMSDERGKVELEFPDGVRPVGFEYKDEALGMPGTEPGPQYGVLAQDLEKSREGRTVVDEDPASGMKMVDTPKLTMLLAGKAAEFEERLKRLEGDGRGRA